MATGQPNNEQSQPVDQEETKGVRAEDYLVAGSLALLVGSTLRETKEDSQFGSDKVCGLCGKSRANYRTHCRHSFHGKCLA